MLMERHNLTTAQDVHKTALAIRLEARRILMPDRPGKDERHRIDRFITWLEANQLPWHNPNLKAYRDHLLAEGLSMTSVAAHLGTLRGRYESALVDQETLRTLYQMATEVLESGGQEVTPANQWAVVATYLEVIRNAINPKAAPLRVRRIQDRADSEHLRLTIEQAQELLYAPDISTLRGVRDRAIIAQFLATGAREAEIAQARVDDLRQKLSGELAFRIRSGKGRKQRLVPYGKLERYLRHVDAWLKDAEINSGPVFRGFYPNGKTVRKTAITERQIQNILKRYPVLTEDGLVIVRPHDLRRTYARRLYDSGMPLPAIAANLGHDDIKTTMGYIGEADVDDRLPSDVYDHT